MPEAPLTYLLVDGENIDMALGSILNRKPEPGQRPRWQQLFAFAERTWGAPVRALFFINATKGYPAPFVQALLAMGYRPVLLAGRDDEKVVDIAICRTLDALRDRPGNVLLASHDGDFVDHLAALCDGTGRRVGVIGFGEFLSQAYRQVTGLEQFDLEDDAAAFEFVLPRVRVIPIDQFDPTRFL